MSAVGAARAAASAACAERVLFVCCAPDSALAVASTRAEVELASASSLAELAQRLAHWHPTCVLLDMDRGEAGEALRLLASSEAGPIRRVLLASPAALFAALGWVAAQRAEHVLMKPVCPEDVLATISASSPAAAPRLPSLDRLQWEYIQAVLGACQGNVSEAARQLGMFRQSLQRILRRQPPRH
jgi:ActR/RegA family two-component response regulator